LKASERRQRRWKMKATITTQNERVLVTFDYHRDAVEAIKQIPGRKFDGFAKMWILGSQYEARVVDILKKYNFDIEKKDEKPVPEEVMRALVTVFKSLTYEDLLEIQTAQMQRLDEKGLPRAKLEDAWDAVFKARMAGYLKEV
jgi:DNA primase large subunit